MAAARQLSSVVLPAWVAPATATFSPETTAASRNPAQAGVSEPSRTSSARECARRTNFFFFRDQTGIESHFSILGARSGSQDGHIWQFMNTDRKAEANLRANRFPDGTGAISIETEDNGDPDHQPWSQRQLDSLRWLHDKLARMYPTIPR